MASDMTSEMHPTDESQVVNYEGTELPLFLHAINWKNYIFSLIHPMTVGCDVLEVGSGIGGVTAILETGEEKSWLCLEPDPDLIKVHCQKLRDFPDNKVRIRNGAIQNLESQETFDTILYIDVLEHIEDDAAELDNAARFLRPGGRLIVLSPAHQWLYSAFDKSIGHCRRYNKAGLLSLSPDSLRLEKIIYLDSFGLLASLCNALLLKQNVPTGRQIKFWDSVFVRLSRLFDPLTGYSIGKSIYCVWIK
jgi:SAM-dependent methyltransferase